MAPQAGLEPAHPAPEAGALSAELLGLSSSPYRVKTVEQERFGALRPRLRSSDSCFQTLPMWNRRVSSPSAGSVSSHWLSSTARLCSSTTRCTSDRAVARRSRAFDDGVAYATKAFLCKAMARLADEEGLCLDVSTGGELEVALAAGVPAARLVLHGNNKSDAELARALSVGVGRMVVDSFDEIARLGRLTEDVGPKDRRPCVLVRVTPGVEAHTHEFVRTGQEDTKFGFSVASGAAAEAVAALELMGGVELVGVHAHIGSQVFEVDSFEQAAEVLGGFAAPLGLPELVVGGGLGVAYVNGEHAPSITEWADATRKALAKVGLPAGTRVTAEPGRSIVATAGMTLYRVGVIKELPGIRTYVSVDGGMSDNPRPVLYGSGYEAFLPRATERRPPEGGPRRGQALRDRRRRGCRGAPAV